MNGKLASGAVAGVAALALAGLGSTVAVPTSGADVTPNLVGAGILQLDLGADGRADTTLAVDGILPGEQRDRLIWVAANDRTSTMRAALGMTVGDVHDTAAACDTSLDKARAEMDSGISGCTIRAGVVSGTPVQGNLSRVLMLDVRSAGRTVADCAPTGSSGSTTSLLAARDRTIPLGDGATPLVLAPGQGVCVEVSVSWPARSDARPDPDHPLDNAVQGDSVSVDVRFDLTQVVG